MLTSDKLKELEDKKKAAIAAIDAEIEQVKNLAKAHEDFAALVSKYKYENATAFLAALNLIPATKKTRKEKTPKATAAPSGDSLKKGPFSEVEKTQILKMHNDDKLTPAQIAAKVKRSEKAIKKILAV